MYMNIDMNAELIGLIAVGITLLCVSGFIFGASNEISLGVESPFNPNGAQTKSIEQIKAENISENLDALQKYCEALGIDCSKP